MRGSTISNCVYIATIRNPQLPIARGGFPIYPVSELLPIPASSLEKKVSPLAAVGLWYELI